MKRTPLKRKTPLRRKRPRATVKPRSKYKRRERDVTYMMWVKRQPCAAHRLVPDLCEACACYGEVQADHAGRRGMGQKADDRTCIPLCRRHHDCRSSFSGPFKGWTQDQMRAWIADTVRDTRAAYEAYMPRRNL